MNKLSSKERGWFNQLTPSKVSLILLSEGWKLLDQSKLPSRYEALGCGLLKKQEHEILVVPESCGDWKIRMVELIEAVAEVEDWSTYETLQYLATGKRMVEVDLTFDRWQERIGGNPRSEDWAIALAETSFHSGSVFKGVICCDRGELFDLKASSKGGLRAKFYVDFGVSMRGVVEAARE